MYSATTQLFALMADRCIIKSKRLASGIKCMLSLPKDTRVVMGSHYRCARCLGKKPKGKQGRKDLDS
jgi:hypothetical protein